MCACVCVCCFRFNFPICSCVQILYVFEFQCGTRLKYVQCHMGDLIWFWLITFFLFVASIFLLPFAMSQKEQANQTLNINRHLIHVLYLPSLPLCSTRHDDKQHIWHAYANIKRIHSTQMDGVFACVLFFAFCEIRRLGSFTAKWTWMCRAIVTGGG